jgi:acetylornithine deacetylase/succinyl-diaminopimelate desuccinylase-like protein
MREDRWHSPPFAPAVRKGRLFGRGAADDKAGIILHAAGIAAWMDGAGRLPVNVKVLIEGEEEAGSPGLNRFLKKYRRMLKADLMVCADLSNFEAGLPTITTSLRGLVALELEVLALKSPLHSGMWGGVVPDPILELSKILSGLETPSGKIAIPEFYRMAHPPGRAELNAFNRLPSNSRRFARQAGMLCGEKGLCVPPSRLWRTLWRTPSLNVNSIESGGRRLAGNVVMDRAWCRMGIRTVPGMDSREVLALLEKKIRSLASPRVRVVLKPDTMGDAWVADTRSPCFRVYEEALRMGYGKNPVYAGCGGSIPFAGTLSSILGEIPSLLIGVEDPGSNVHSENESVDLRDLLKAIRSQVLFFDLLSSGVSSRSRV